MSEMDRTIIREAVREGVVEALMRLGIDTQEPTEVQADMIYLRKARMGADEIMKWTKRTTISIALSSLLLVVWEGFKMITRAP
jgi:hypothetical protein